MRKQAKQIAEKVLSMDDEQLQLFLSRLTPDTLEHLDIILEKIEKGL